MKTQMNIIGAASLTSHFFLWRKNPSRAYAISLLKFLHHA